MTALLSNGMLLLVPPFLWNALFYRRLPDFYQPSVWDKIPKGLDRTENILRCFSFFTPVLLRIGLEGEGRRIGAAFYLIGLLLYFSSWIIQIALPCNRISTSPVLRMAPAYTTIVWLLGIGMLAEEAYLPHARVLYFPVVSAFALTHSYHAGLIVRSEAEGRDHG